MNDLRQRLANANVRYALIVDDVFDPVPLAAELVFEGEEWANFFDDLSEADRNILKELSPEFDALDAEELRWSNGFIQQLWHGRSRLRPELINPVFSRYDVDMEQDREYVNQMITQLESCGLEVSTAGRDFVNVAARADLIVIDLFLGSIQDSEAITLSKRGLKEIVATRSSRPPLVILTSRSSRLANKRVEFRDEVGLLASAFRITAKAEISGGKLARLLSVLTDHYSDSTKLAAFLDAWKLSVTSAVNGTLALMRTLELSDYAQVQRLLLTEEGEPTGSYMVDIFDRVLQHEVEREGAMIDAARALDSITSDSYPPPHLSGSPDLQLLVHRLLFQHRERLRLGETPCGVAFGDLLRTSMSDQKSNPPLADIRHENLLAVMTPACDLQRDGAKRVMLLVGTLKPLTACDWSYKDDPVRTAVIQLIEGRFWIQWDLKHVDMISPISLKTAIENGYLEIIARMRESHALQLQQKLLSSMGRVGLPGLMPAAFPVKVQICYPDSDSVLCPLIIPSLETDGTCYVGRPGIKAMRLVLTESACEEIAQAIAELDVALVHNKAAGALQYLKENPDELTVALNKGLELPSPDAGGFKDIPSPSGAMNGSGSKVRSIGIVSRKVKDGQKINNGDSAKAGVIVLVTDPPRREAPVDLSGSAEEAPEPDRNVSGQ